jgi:hypothetical protein
MFCPRSSEIEYEADSLLAFPQGLFSHLSFCDVFRERHEKWRRVRGAGDQGGIVSDSDRSAILAQVLLLKLTLLPLSFERLGDDAQVSLAVVSYGHIWSQLRSECEFDAERPNGSRYLG